MLVVKLPNNWIFSRPWRRWNPSEMRGSGIAVSGIGAKKVIPPWRIDNPRHRVFPPSVADASGLAAIPLAIHGTTS